MCGFALKRVRDMIRTYSLKVLVVKHSKMQIYNFFQSNLPDIQKGITRIECINPYRPYPGRREKINLKVLFSDFFVVPQSFVKALKAFIKPFKAQQRKAKIIF